MVLDGIIVQIDFVQTELVIHLKFNDSLVVRTILKNPSRSPHEFKLSNHGLPDRKSYGHGLPNTERLQPVHLRNPEYA